MVSGARRSKVRRDELILGWSLAGLAVLAVAVFWATMHLAAAWNHQPAPPNRPITLIAQLIRGRIRWPRRGFVVLGGLVGVVAVAAVVMLVIRRRPRSGKAARGDQAASLMGTGRDLEAISQRSVQATATRFGITAAPGIRIAKTVAGGRTLWQGWEDVSTDIWGPRQGKTSTRVIPAVVGAPGAVVVTSNKRDVVDATRGVRAGLGRVWVFDLQGICGETPTWWWNPLSYIANEVDAQNLAHIFVTAGRSAEAKTDAYFDTAGEELVAGMLLAAAVGVRPITEVYLWLTRPTDTEPAVLLAEAGYRLIASALQNTIDAPDKQRDGVYGTARIMVRFLTNTSAMRWVTPDGPDATEDTRPRFDPDIFVREGTQTMYCLSKEGKGSMGPLVTAMTVAVTEAAERLSERSPYGRLPVPMLLALDEAANICRWKNLPDLYSHFGSRGIIPMTILQSWAQGEEVWGKAGMTKLWAASTVKVVGSGVGGGDFLSDLSTLIGDWDSPTLSRNSGGRGQGVSYTAARQRERIMDVADIAALPKGRAIVMAAGARPALCATLPWMNGPHADAVKASIAAFDPNAASTIAAAVDADVDQEVAA